MRAILIRDGIAGLFGGSQSPPLLKDSTARQVSIRSGPRRLDGLLFLPVTEPKASLVILHGIGERLSYWREAQGMLAEHGIASLIFDYSGYGKSAGATTPENLRQDTLAAYHSLRALLPDGRPPFLLGLSLGTGVASDAAPHLKPAPSGVVLCEAFSSLRSAAEAVLAHVPLPGVAIRGLARLLPDVYRTSASIRQVASPLLIVHSDSDELFPVAMAREIFAAAREDEGRSATLSVPHGYAHNDAYLTPEPGYWQPILDFLLKPGETPAKR
jgi:alpha-beta hydrolase superfamily lysophospholipase